MLSLRRRFKHAKAAFTSYLKPESSAANAHLKPESSAANICGDGMVKDLSVPGEFCNPEIQLLNGEAIKTQVDNVLYFNSFSCSEMGQRGRISVTNFRITFNAYKLKDSPTTVQSASRNLLTANEDIVLNNIEAIYKVKRKKKKILTPDVSVGANLDRLEIHCKDFRIFVFGFKLTAKADSIAVVHSIVQETFSSNRKFDLSPNCQMDSSLNEEDEIPKFNNESDWTNILAQLKVDRYKVVQCNSNFHVSDSLPECFVVPSSMSADYVVDISKKFVNNRCPVWSYTCTSGASLIRMSFCIPGVTDGTEASVLSHIKSSDPSKRNPELLDLSTLLPSLSELQTSFVNLRQLCMTATIKSFWVTDSSWLSTLELSGWLSIISRCLEVSTNASSTMHSSKLTVVLKEKESTDMCPLVSCLVQLMLNEDSRTLVGFESLIEREWVALGHRFADRYKSTANCRSSTSIQSPVFLLFLDCLWQMLRQFPSSFQFTEIYLVSLWDSLCLGLFRNFKFNNARDCQYSPKKRHPDQATFVDHPNTMPFLSVWNWKQQFSEDQISLFYNPLYVLKHEQCLQPDSPTLSSSTGSIGNESVFLRPSHDAPFLQLWSLCYLRWLSPAQIVNGGQACEYLTQCLLVEEILYLQQMIVDTKLTNGSVSRRQSRLIFSSDEFSSPERFQSSTDSCITSSFPFTSIQSVDDTTTARHNLDIYFKNSILCQDTSGADEMDE